MTFASLALLSVSCLFMQQHPAQCINTVLHPEMEPSYAIPEFTGRSVDVITSAEALLVWDVDSNRILYEKNAYTKRPVASISKLLSAMVVRDALALDHTVEIPEDVLSIQRRGVHLRLTPGERATVRQLLAASMVRSANDAIVALAVAVSGSEDAFVRAANEHATQLGLTHTLVANASGLSGGEQYSTAHDVMELMKHAWEDATLRQYMTQEKGVLETFEGAFEEYETTNQLIGTYLPILAGKTGFTDEAKQNLVIITRGAQGERIGVVVLGSEDRFQDTKSVVEWIWRNYTW